MRLRLGPLGAPAAIVLAWVTVRVIVLLPQPNDSEVARHSTQPTRQASSGPAKAAQEFSDANRALSPPPRLVHQAIIHAPLLKWDKLRFAGDAPPRLGATLAEIRTPAEPHAESVFQGRSGVVAGYIAPNRAPHRAFTGSGWALVNGTGGAVGVPSLGGSQTGLRLFLQGADAPLALTARVSRALGASRDTEVSAGYGLRAQGFGLLVERRQRLDVNSGAFAVTGYGGVYDVKLPGGLRFDGFAQGGIAGLRQRRWFADGQARLTGRMALSSQFSVGAGGGAWASAQQGTRRIEAGPLIEARVRTGAVGLRVAGEYGIM